MSRGYGQYCPVSLATEILGERWTILVVSALIDGTTRFNDLQRAMPRISATVLSQRLRSLEDAGILSRRPLERGKGFEYRLTEAGRELEPVVMGLANWGQRWARDLKADDLDPRFLAWSIHLRMNTAAMPSGRTVIEFEFSGAPSDCRRFWIIAVGGEVDMCIHHPGFEPDLQVRSDLRRFVDVWRGFRPLVDELAAGRIALQGPSDLVKAFPNWLLLSSVAPTQRLRPGRERQLSRRSQPKSSN